jgi:acetyltransferase-like isoleucine patch superfamily enzyme
MLRFHLKFCMKLLVKRLLQGLSLAIAFLPALVSGFGRIATLFTIGAQSLSQVPGLPGDYVRIAFYKLTLKRCSLESRISFGSFFAHPEAEIGERVYIGSYCVLGRCTIGDRTQIASHVQILSGRRQHGRDESGQVAGSDEEAFETVPIGADCWIGAGAIVMAPVGAKTTIGAGAVVVAAIESEAVAVGNPARVIKKALPVSVS